METSVMNMNETGMSHKDAEALQSNMFLNHQYIFNFL